MLVEQIIYLQEVSKILGQNERVSSPHHNEGKSSHKRMFGNEWSLSLTEELYSTKNTLTM